MLTITMILISVQGFTQSEPDAFNKKDLIEKMDRADLDMNSEEKVKIDDSILKFEIPKIEFAAPVKKSQASAKKANTSTKKVVKEATTVTKKTNKTSSVKTSPVEKDKIKVSFAKRPILISQMKKNDKIVITKGKTYVYRMLKTSIIQYKYNGKIPFDSKGLRKNDETSYYIVDKKLLLEDYKKSRSNTDKSKTKSKTKKPPRTSVPRRTGPKKTSPKKDKKLDVQSISDDVASKRKIIEDKYNNGKKIKKTIGLKNLHQNDEVYIVGDIQFVFRVSSSSSGKKKFWLIEKLDINNEAVQKIGKNKYKIIKFYKTK